MPEPTSSAAATIAAAGATVPALTVFGVATGLRPDILLAGFAGALAAMILLNTVPGLGDTWRELLKTSTRRVAVAVASSLVAGYLAPLVLLIDELPPSIALGVAFVVGAGAQRFLVRYVRRWAEGGSTEGANA